MNYVFQSAETVNKRLMSSNLPDCWDDESRSVVINLLNCYSKDKIKEITEMPRTSHYDLCVIMQNNNVNGIEIKFRDGFNSEAFDTHMVDQAKLYNLNVLRRDGILNGCLLFTIWNNGVVYASDMINGQYTIEEKEQNVTTRSGQSSDGKKKPNVGIYYKPDYIFYYAYRVYVDGTRVPVFSKEPINVEELNKKLAESQKLF